MVSDENAFLPLFLSVGRTTGKIVEYYSKMFPPPRRGAGLWHDAAFFSSRSELRKKASARQAMFGFRN